LLLPGSREKTKSFERFATTVSDRTGREDYKTERENPKINMIIDDSRIFLLENEDGDPGNFSPEMHWRRYQGTDIIEYGIEKILTPRNDDERKIRKREINGLCDKLVNLEQQIYSKKMEIDQKTDNGEQTPRRDLIKSVTQVSDDKKAQWKSTMRSIRPKTKLLDPHKYASLLISGSSGKQLKSHSLYTPRREVTRFLSGANDTDLGPKDILSRDILLKYEKNKLRSQLSGQERSNEFLINPTGYFKVQSGKMPAFQYISLDDQEFFNADPCEKKKEIFDPFSFKISLQSNVPNKEKTVFRPGDEIRNTLHEWEAEKVEEPEFDDLPIDAHSNETSLWNNGGNDVNEYSEYFNEFRFTGALTARNTQPTGLVKNHAWIMNICRKDLQLRENDDLPKDLRLFSDMMFLETLWEDTRGSDNSGEAITSPDIRVKARSIVKNHKQMEFLIPVKERSPLSGETRRMDTDSRLDLLGGRKRQAMSRDVLLNSIRTSPQYRFTLTGDQSSGDFGPVIEHSGSSELRIPLLSDVGRAETFTKEMEKMSFEARRVSRILSSLETAPNAAALNTSIERKPMPRRRTRKSHSTSYKSKSEEHQRVIQKGGDDNFAQSMNVEGDYSPAQDLLSKDSRNKTGFKILVHSEVK